MSLRDDAQAALVAGLIEDPAGANWYYHMTLAGFCTRVCMRISGYDPWYVPRWAYALRTAEAGFEWCRNLGHDPRYAHMRVAVEAAYALGGPDAVRCLLLVEMDT